MIFGLPFEVGRPTKGGKGWGTLREENVKANAKVGQSKVSENKARTKQGGQSNEDVNPNVM